MDPNATLAEILAAARKIETDPSLSLDDIHDHAVELAERVIALDEWLRRGGFLPTAWQASASAVRY